MKAIKIWIAVSEQGHPATFIGYAYTRTDLEARYQGTFKSSLKDAGYRAVKATLTMETK
jgi:hypothetical protein